MLKATEEEIEEVREYFEWQAPDLEVTFAIQASAAPGRADCFELPDSLPECFSQSRDERLNRLCGIESDGVIPFRKA